jgi:hypothetical protein
LILTVDFEDISQTHCVSLSYFQNCRIFNNFNGCYMIVEGITHKDVNLSPALWEVQFYLFVSFLSILVRSAS